MVSFSVWASVATTVVLFLWLKFADRDILLFLSQILRRRDPEAFLEKVVWITGASQGLGELLAKHFSSKGAKLILSSRNAEKLKRVADACGTPERNHILPFDLRSADWDEVAASALSSFPEGIDYVIHNTGMSQHSVASETKAHIVNDVFQLNATGAVSLTQAVLPGMVKQGRGHFIVLSSMAGKVPSPGQAIYCASKYATLGYFHTLRTELAATPIGVTICCPGPFKFGEAVTTREVYHSEGLVKEEMVRSAGLNAQKAVQLIALAAECKLSECWMAKQPVLLMAYLMQYFPVVGSYLLDKIGPKRAAAVTKGKGYALKSIFNKDKAK